MSFLGSIGYIMSGSGIKEVLSTVYAMNSIDKMLSGHNFAQALHAHFLMHEALGHLLIQDAGISEIDLKPIK